MTLLNKFKLQIKSLFLIAIVLFFEVKAQCKLSKDQLQNGNYLLATTDALGHYELLQMTEVPAETSLTVFCSTGSTQPANQFIVKCQSVGQFSPSLPTARQCDRIDVQLMSTTDDGCGHSSHRLGYKVNGIEFEVFRACYDDTRKTTKYTVHKRYTPSIGCDICNPPARWLTEPFIPTASFEVSSIRNAFQSLLGSGQNYMDKSNGHNPQGKFFKGHLSPCCDFLYGHDRIASYHLINVVPQAAEINNGNWKKLEDWVRKTCAQSVSSVLTGALGVLKLKHTSGQWVDMYMDQGQFNPIPEWMYKIVKCSTNSYQVFIAYNNMYNFYNNEAHLNPNPSAVCSQIPCPDSLKFKPAENAGQMYCCEPNSFMQTNSLNGINF